jgi:hypothetical protein
MSDVKRTSDGKWEKGASPNPGGRPKLIVAFRKALEERHYEKALMALETALDDDDAKVRIAAAREVLDRLFGKASQPVTDADGNPVMFPLAPFLERLAK